MITFLVFVLAVSAAYTIGRHDRRRVRISLIPDPAPTLTPDDEQLVGEWRARLDQLTAPFEHDTPEQP